MLNEQEITSLPISNKDILGIQITEIKPPDMVSLLEEYSARKEGGYNVFEWDELTPYERAAEVAHYRIMKAIEYQQMKKSEIKSTVSNNGI